MGLAAFNRARRQATEREAEAPAQADAGSEPKGDALADLTVADLRAKAKEADIEGYSAMRKAELVEALSDVSTD